MSVPNEMSFLPDDYLDRKAQRRSNVMCALLAVIVIGTIGAAFTVTERMNRTVDDENAAVTAQYTEAAKEITQVQQLQTKQRQMAHEAELSASLLEKVPRSTILAEITNALPPGVSLLDFVLDAKRRPPAVPTPDKMKSILPPNGMAVADSAPVLAEPMEYDVTLKLTGIADTDVQVSSFISQLSHSKLLTDVNLLISDEYAMADQKLRRFQLEMKLSPTADVGVAEVTGGSGGSANGALASVKEKP
ncbi:MAG: PilN domain-containing protein [Planctomycetota bacterium]|nr:PilN domain-containing protein [Planctomycetota bacterium]